MALLDLILACVLPIFAGAGLLASIGVTPRLDRLAWAGWALMAGLLATAVLLWIALAFELPLTSGWMRLVLAAVGIGGMLAGLRRVDPTAFASLDVVGPPPRPTPEPRAPLGTASKIGMAACLLLAAASATDSVLYRMTTPVAVKDEATNWTSKAKQLFIARGFNDSLGREIDESLRLAVRAPHPNYPNLVPLIHLWSFVNAGRILHFEGRIPVLLFRYALLLVLAGALLRRWRSPAAGLLLLPATFNLYRRDEGADVIAAFGLLLAADALARFFEDGGRGWWRLAALGSAFLVAAKHEGQILLLALGVAACVAFIRSPERLRTPRLDWLWVLAPAAALLSTWWFNQRFDVWNKVVSADAGGMSFLGRVAAHGAERFPALLGSTWDVLAGDAVQKLDARYVHLAFLVLVAACAKPAFSGGVQMTTLVIALAWLAMIPVFVGTPYPFRWFVDVALARVMDQWAPLVCLWIAMLWRAVSSGAGRWRTARLALIGVCVAALAAGPLVSLWRSGLPAGIARTARVLGENEDARLDRYFSEVFSPQLWPAFQAVRDRTRRDSAVVLVLPVSHVTSDVWAAFAALLYPKRILLFVPGAESLTATLKQFNIDYDNALEPVVRLAGPQFDVLAFEAAGPLPPRLQVEWREKGEGFVLGEGLLMPVIPETR